MSGTTNRSKDQLDKEVDFIGASLSADKNSISMSCLTKHMDKGLSLLNDVLMNANFPESEFDRIRKQNEDGLLAAKSDAGTMAQNATVKVNFPGHPFSDVMNETTLKNITRQDVINYYKSNFTPDGAYLVVVGDITRMQTEEMVAKYFGEWKGGKKYVASFPEATQPEGNQVTFVKKRGAVQSVVYITFPIKMKTGDVNQLPSTVLNGILGGGGFGTRLMQNLREDKAYTYGCYSAMNIKENGSWMSAGGNFRNAVTDSAITQILKEFELITTELVKDDEINLTKSSQAGGFARSLESPSTIARFALNTIKYKLPKDYYQNYLQRLEGVNKDDILNMAKSYFTSTNCNIIVVGNEEILDKLKKFDSDGKVTILDEFGNPFKDMAEADITKEQLITNYLLAVTKSSSMKELTKKLKKVKSVERVSEMSGAQMPMTLKFFNYYLAPATEATALEFQGNKMPLSYFDGKSGYTSATMAGKKDMTADEIAKKQKEAGLFQELNYATNNTNYSLEGIQTENDTEYYVVKIVDGETESYDYFNRKTFLKEKSLTITKEGEKTNESTQIFGDYKEVKGLLFPHSMSMNMGPMILSGQVVKIEVNGKPDMKLFKK
ncbi:MAG: insulinase family protein [Bacteroidetes bacterium]|nr:insulinase family protein [Bacteroidota bacterium]